MIVVALVAVTWLVDADDTIDRLKQTLGRLNMAYKQVQETNKQSDIDQSVNLITELEKGLAELKGKLSDGVFATDKKAVKVESKLKELEIEVTGKPPGKCRYKTADGDYLKVHFVGKTLHDGKVFDSSFHTGSLPIKFKLGFDDFPDGWHQGLTGMCEGERRKLLIPAALAFGDEGRPGIPPGADISYDTELVSFYSAAQDKADQDL